MRSNLVDRWPTYTALLLTLIACQTVLAADPVALRIESFGVAPAHAPSAVVQIKNLRDVPYRGVLRVTVPAVWQLSPTEQEVDLAPGQTKRVPFVVKRGTIAQENVYPLEASATGGGVTVTRRQNVVTASAPYFKPEIDGKIDDWKDAIPVTFITGGKKTVVHTFWNRRQFSILVAVEEERRIAHGTEPNCDAVQIAISPQDTRTGTSAEEEATRFEFLLVATGGGTQGRGEGTQGKCFKLAEPGMALGVGSKLRELESLAFDDAVVAVSRVGGVTYYECGIPFKLMRDRIRPSEGREFHLSVLIHDPDGTGLRDWGAAAGMWPSQRNRLAWSLWPGAVWGEKPPFDNKLQWGLCSSKY